MVKKLAVIGKKLWCIKNNNIVSKIKNFKEKILLVCLHLTSQFEQANLKWINLGLNFNIVVLIRKVAVLVDRSLLITSLSSNIVHFFLLFFKSSLYPLYISQVLTNLWFIFKNLSSLSLNSSNLPRSHIIILTLVLIALSQLHHQHFIILDINAIESYHF